MRSLLLVLCLSASSFAATEFDKLDSAFKSGLAPEHKQLNGYWAGRCVGAADPNRLTAAVLVHKLVEDSSEFPPKRPSFSYYTSVQIPENYFDKLTPSGVESYQPVKAHFAKEAWEKAVVIEGSLVTHQTLSTGERIERAARLFEDEFSTLVLLRVTKGAMVQRHCFFNKALGGQDGEPPHPVGELIAKSGPIGNRWAVLTNPTPHVVLSSIWIENAEGPVTLQDTTIQIAEGIAAAPRTIALPSHVSTRLYMVDGQPFRMANLSFYVRGYTSNLTIRGVTYRGEPWAGRLQFLNE